MGFGGRGTSALTGKLSTANTISAGRNQLVLSSLSVPSLTTNSSPPLHTFVYSATTKGLSTVGITGEATTRKLTSSLDESVPCSSHGVIQSSSTFATCQVLITQPTGLQEEFTPRKLCSSLPSRYLKTSSVSLALQTPTQQKEKLWDIVNVQLTLRLSSKTNIMTTSGETSCYNSTTHDTTNTSRFARMAPIVIADTTAHTRPYVASLTPNASPLCPHCLARDHLRLWLPHISRSRLNHTGSLVRISDSDID